MRIAVVSDIHGNATAFEAIIADWSEEPIDRVVCLGDAVMCGLDAARVVHLLKSLDALVVMGNGDDILLHGEESADYTVFPRTDWMDWYLTMRDWQLERLSAEDMAYIASLPQTVEVPLPNGKRLLGAHGSPQHFHHEIRPETPDEEARNLLGPIDNAIVCGGPTHLQQIRQLGENCFFNPGSVSLPSRRDSAEGWHRVNPWAEYAVLTVEESGREALEFRRVPYDVAGLIAAIDASGVPEPHRLSDFYRPS
jgi:predicted phosphodiesterase